MIITLVSENIEVAHTEMAIFLLFMVNSHNLPRDVGKVPFSSYGKRFSVEDLPKYGYTFSIPSF